MSKERLVVINKAKITMQNYLTITTYLLINFSIGHVIRQPQIPGIVNVSIEGAKNVALIHVVILVMLKRGYLRTLVC